MTRYGFALLAGAFVLLAGGCTTARPDTDAVPGARWSPSAPPSAGPTSAASAPAGSGTGATGPPAAPGSTTAGAGEVEEPRTFRTAYPWGVPAEPVRVSHLVRPPVAQPPAAPLPHLVEIRAADHPGERPAYSRISFSFRGGFPSYELGYVRRLTAEATGEHVPLPGNAVLRLQFIQAQAHDERGRRTVTASPRPELGFPTLRGYAFGGDFEGYLTYGLGLRVVPPGDGLPVRVLELTRTGEVYVIAVDIQHG